MDVKSLFNIILLGLSLTTIFITMVSYIVFKLRQSSFIGGENEFYKLEGSYFRRYAPELEKRNEELKAEIKKQERNPRKFYLKIVGMFSFIFLIIVTVLLADEYYQRRNQINESNTESVYDS